MSLGEKIRKHRILNQLTQKELSIQLGLTAKMISFYENNQRIPPIDILIKLANIFSVSTDYLLGLSSENISMVNYPQIELSEEENTIIKIFRRLNRDYKDIALGELKKYEKLQEYEKNIEKQHTKREA